MSHPAPARGQVPEPLLWLGIFGAPIAWSLQLLINYAAIAVGCSARPDGRGVLSVSGMRGMAGWVALLALLVACGAALAAWRSWRATRGEHAAANAEAHVSLLDVGEGRTRFMAFFGLLSSGLFLIAVLFTALALLLVPGCG